ncbi:MAG TPA: ROK family protein [Candidatus Limnocylindria bacterium]|nr:ROK family protein [Candidatus Limnocylindria bacterium]
MQQAAGQSVLAIDLGGTQLRAAYVSPDASISCRRAVETRGEQGVDRVVARICDLAVQVRDEAAAAGLPPPLGIGISSPGPLDPWRGMVVAPPNLPGWHDVPLADRVEQCVGLPAFLERDTNVAVMCEWRYGAARGKSDVVYITVSTGVGGGIVLGGRPLIGPDGTAGEVGHMTIDLDGPLCGDGQPGHVEAIGSGTAIARAGRELLANDASPALARLADRGDVDAELVARAADEGDEAARTILDRAWEAVGALCASLVNLLNPEIIVLGGGIAVHRPELLDAVRQQIALRAFALPARRVRLALAQYPHDVSLIGSLPIVNERIHDPAFRRG